MLEELVRAIIAQRATSVATVRQLIELIKPMHDHHRKLKDERVALMKLLASESPEETSIAVDESMNAYATALFELYCLLPKLSEAEAWLSREYVSIAMVGMHRIGKSRLIRTITGLNQTEIPTGMGGSLTAAPCEVIYKTDGLPHAEVEFHTIATLREEVIRPLCAIFGFSDFADAFPTTNILPPRPKEFDNRAAEKIYYQSLEKLVAKYPTYDHLIDQKNVTIKKEGNDHNDWIVKYVARYDPTVSNEGSDFPESFAVRSVKIFCKFQTIGAEGIRLFDTPGKGELRHDLEAQLEQTIRRSADMVIVMDLPIGAGPVFDVKIVGPYDIAAKAFDSRDPERAIVIVLNRTLPDQNPDPVIKIDAKFQDNLGHCEQVLGEIGRKGIKSAAVEIVNCVDTGEVGALMQRIIGLLLANLEELDQQYVADVLRPVKEALYAAVAARSRVQNALNALLPTLDAGTLGYERMRTMLESLRAALDDELSKIRTTMTTPDPELDKVFKRVAKEVRDQKLIPAMTELRKAEAGTNPQGAYGYAEKLLRAILWKVLDQLNDSANRPLQAARKKIAAIIRDSSSLGNVIAEDDAEAFLRSLADKFPGTVVGEEMRAYADYKLSPQLLYIVLYNEIMLFNQLREDFTDFSWDRIRDQLTDVLESIANFLEGDEPAILQLLTEPNQIAYVRSQRFRDMAMFSPDAAGKWTGLWNMHRDQIWPDEYGTQIKLRNKVQLIVELVQSSGKELDYLSQPLAAALA